MGQVMQSNVPEDFVCPDCGAEYDPVDGRIVHEHDCPLKDMSIEEVMQISEEKGGHYHPDGSYHRPDDVI